MNKLTIGSFFKNLLQMLHDLLTSKKVATAIATVVTAYLAHDQDLKNVAVAAGVALLLGQGAADFGKVAALSPQPDLPASPNTTPVSPTTDPPKTA